MKAPNKKNKEEKLYGIVNFKGSTWSSKWSAKEQDFNLLGLLVLDFQHQPTT